MPHSQTSLSRNSHNTFIALKVLKAVGLLTRSGNEEYSEGPRQGQDLELWPTELAKRGNPFFLRFPFLVMIHYRPTPWDSILRNDGVTTNNTYKGQDYRNEATSVPLTPLFCEPPAPKKNCPIPVLWTAFLRMCQPFGPADTDPFNAYQMLDRWSTASTSSLP
jgi:hypothetical protein